MRSLAQSVFFATALISQTAYAGEPLEISLSLKNHIFEPRELKVPAGQPLIITVINEDVTAEEFESAALKLEKIVAPKSSIKLRVKGLSPARYEFSGEYNETAKGILIAE